MNAITEPPRLTCSDYYQHVMQALPGDFPCGESLDYDPAFIMLQSRLQPKLGVEYGSFVEAAEPVNWTETERECLALLQKSKDVRLIVILMRCRLRKVGLPALAEGTEALLTLLQTWPDDLYPQLLDEGEFAPMLRANAFAELEDIDGLLADLRNQPLPKAAGLQITIKEFEKAHQIPREEGALSEAAVAALIQEWHLNALDGIQPLLQAHQHLQAIVALLNATLGEEAPELAAFGRILGMFSCEFSAGVPTPPAQRPTPAPQSEEAPPLPVAAPVARPIAPPSPTARNQGINGRTDAQQRLQEVRSWFMAAEPGSPLIPLLQYAERSIGKSFADLLKMYPPEIVALLNQEKE
ncbi:hypothetical protein GJV78_10615 [Escherichia alba]|uniref:ImpA N-terminal domain-containing protein n=1 Tax=Intestinirhabdus alba TaxID=2899544 RepID=A0A6L6IL77_9ENTR|nr:type VI secretion system ImpA family N-terminal domain-containing protein [Intestinirhabdus alba]MTH46694.1 hypothetical protein [Intestinirhabdus alba]